MTRAILDPLTPSVALTDGRRDSVTNLPDGNHTAAVQLCDTTGTTCPGARSTPVPFRVKNLHPTITSAAPTPFSPNGDGVRDTTKIGYSLPDTETVTWKVTGPTGTVKDAVTLGTLMAGNRSFVWNGKTTTGTAVPDGTYAIVLSTAATVSGRKLQGRVTKNVTVDRTAPKISAATGDGTTIYPSGGGSPAGFTTKVTPPRRSSPPGPTRGDCARPTLRATSETAGPSPSRCSGSRSGPPPSCSTATSGTEPLDQAAPPTAWKPPTSRQGCGW